MLRSWSKSRPDVSWIMALGLVLTAAAAFAVQGGDLPPVSEVLRKVEETGAALSFRARGRIVHTSEDDQRKVYQLAIVQKRMAHGTSLLWSITDPPEARTRILIESKTGGGTSVRMARGKDAPESIPASKWPEPLLGMHLTIGDLADNHFSWPAQKILREEACGARQCYVVQSEYEKRNSSPYVSVTSWVDQETFLPIIVRKTPAESGAGKEILCRGTRRSGSHWLATGIEMKIPGVAGSTRLTFTRGSVSSPIKDEELDPQSVFGGRKAGQ